MSRTWRLCIAIFGLHSAGCTTHGAVALDRAVMAYDHTTVDLVTKLLLLNIARAHLDKPMHFTSVSSIAATYAFGFNAGVGPAMTGDLGYLPMGSVGGSTMENPTITITPMQGDEFTQRLLTPFEEQKVTMLLRQGYDVDTLLRLMAAELRVQVDGNQVIHYNRPSDAEGYKTFRRVMSHLSSIQDRHALHVEPVQFKLKRTVAAASLSPEMLDDPSLSYDPDKQIYQVDARVTGRVVITNYDHSGLPNDERVRLQEEAKQAPPNQVLLDIRPQFVGGEYPLHGSLRLRSFLNVLTFIGRDIAAEREFDVAPDPRSPPVNENPAHTLEIVESDRDSNHAELSVHLADHSYALATQGGYQWNKKAFTVLYQLFQMSVAPAPANTPLITIAK